MSAIDDVTAFAQAVYLQTHGITNDVTGTDLTDFLNQTIIWTNQFKQELELKADWKFSRIQNNNLGTVLADTTNYTISDTIRKPVYHPQRLLTIQQDGVIVSKWTLVDPDQIYDANYAYNPQHAMIMNGTLVLSRAPYDYEVGGTIVADTISWLPDLTLSDSSLLSIVKPQKLLVLGVSKDSLPPDLVRGGTANLIETRYEKLLRDAIIDNGGSSFDDDQAADDLGYITGVYLNG